jgi:hypothetical protein
MELIVSLPRNDAELAKAAADNGADMLKVHMNVTHAASKTVFGSYAEEAPAVRNIIQHAGIPVGLMPGTGGDALPTQQELEELAGAGLSFVDIYTRQMPLWFMYLPLRRMIAFDSFDGFVEPAYYQSHMEWPFDQQEPVIWMVEASICPQDEYGQPFSYYDYRRLRILQEYVDRPLAVPTQKHITPDDARWLKRTGTGALIIGAVVTGGTAEGTATATRAFRDAIDSVED